jgi:hypothetical protein
MALTGLPPIEAGISTTPPEPRYPMIVPVLESKVKWLSGAGAALAGSVQMTVTAKKAIAIANFIIFPILMLYSLLLPDWYNNDMNDSTLCRYLSNDIIT